MDAMNTDDTSTKACKDMADRLQKMAEKAGSKLLLERAGYLKRAAQIVGKAADTED